MGWRRDVVVERDPVTGRVVASPDPGHRCNPGVIDRECPPEEAPFPGAVYAVIPDRWSHPPGTVWECDCGRSWVAWRPRGADASGQIGRIWWRREGRLRRWLRKRRAPSRTAPRMAER